MKSPPAHRRIAGVVAFWCAAAVAMPVAGANTVVVLGDSEQDHQLAPALEVALAAQRVHVASMPPPVGTLRLERAAAAQRTALSANANAAVWVDNEAGTFDVCVVSAESGTFRHAPMPEPSPRVFAAIATSLLDELLAPPSPNITVDVDVHVNVDGAGRVAALSPVMVDVVPGAVSNPPGLVSSSASDELEWVARDRHRFEIGAMVSPLSIGVEGTLLFPLSPRWQFGVTGSANIAFVDTADTGAIVFGAMELRRVGGGRRHFDWGPIAGAVYITGDSDAPGMISGMRFGKTWERAGGGTTLSIAPVVVIVPADNVAFPGVWASLRWSLAI